MPWWGWLLLGGALVGSFVLILWLLLRKRASTVDRSGLIDSERTRLEAELAAEKRARSEVEEVSKRLEAELRGIAERNAKALEDVNETARKDRTALANDPDALLARLDAILRGDPDG